MATYLLKRLLQGIIVLLAVSFVCFIIFRYTGDPVLMLAGKYATQQQTIAYLTDEKTTLENELQALSQVRDNTLAQTKSLTDTISQLNARLQSLEAQLDDS